MRHKSKILHAVSYYIPPVVWMIFIFFLSSHQSIGVTHTYMYDFLLFKSLHMIEYAILFFLWFRAFHPISKTPLVYKYTAAICLSILFAASDEIHQLFVQTRQGKLQDIVIDTSGILIMYIIVKRHMSIFKRLL